MGPGLPPSLKLRRPQLHNPGEALAKTGRRDDDNHSHGAVSPEFCNLVVPPRKRAQGKPGADCARSPVCEKCAKGSTRVNYRYSRDIPAFPAQCFYDLYVISPVSGVFCHRHRRDASRRLDATVAAPGPHDFAVRCDRFRPVRNHLRPQRPSHPAPYVS